MAYYKIKEDLWLEYIFRQATKEAVYGLVRRGSGLSWQRMKEPAEIVLFEARPVEPIKLFFYFPSESVATLPEVPVGNEKRRILLGVKACDLEALKVADYIYRQGEVVDPNYANRRDQTLIISSDCTNPCPTCFCTLHGRAPYSREGFDLNLSPLGSEVLIEVGSPRGEEFVKDLKSRLTVANEADIKKSTENRQNCQNKVDEINKLFRHRHPYSETVRKAADASAWKKYGQEMCVQCHACNLGCPTCYCFSFADSSATGEGMKRFKNWDSCITASFGRMASGANPRPMRWERFRYHYYHKFDFLNTSLGFDACTGCGRCIDGCLGKIDKRQVLVDLEKEVYGSS